MKKIDKEISKILDPIFTKQNRILYQLVKSWHQIVGPKFALHTNPSKVSFNSNIATLHITSSSHSMATDLFYSQPLILEKIFIFLGSDLIKKLRINTVPNNNISVEHIDIKGNDDIYIIPDSYIKNVQEIKDSDLAEVLQNFLKAFRPMR